MSTITPGTSTSLAPSAAVMPLYPHAFIVSKCPFCAAKCKGSQASAASASRKFVSLLLAARFHMFFSNRLLALSGVSPWFPSKTLKNKNSNVAGKMPLLLGDSWSEYYPASAGIVGNSASRARHDMYREWRTLVQQGSLHYTPEHCLVNCGFPLFWWKKTCFK